VGLNLAACQFTTTNNINKPPPTHRHTYVHTPTPSPGDNGTLGQRAQHGGLAKKLIRAQNGPLLTCRRSQEPEERIGDIRYRIRIKCRIGCRAAVKNRSTTMKS
jgi:hypothetical protein